MSSPRAPRSRFVRSLNFIAFLSTFHNFPIASAAGRRSKKPPALPLGFQFNIPLLRAVGTAEQVEQVHPDAIPVSHDETPRTKDLSASLPVPQTVANKALTFDSLHSKSRNKSWRLRNFSSKLKSRPTPRHHLSNLKVCLRCQQSAKVQTSVSSWDNLIIMLG